MNHRPDEAEQAVRLDIGPVELEGDLCVPAGAFGIVLFAHGSGSGRHSSRNRFVARQLQRAGLATLLIDLLTAREEEAERAGATLRFDIDLLAGRLLGATDWLARQRLTAPLGVGYFGASTGGAAALVAAAERPERAGAVVSRGGRPDLAGRALDYVRAPTLLIVGGRDVEVLALNREAMRHLDAEKRLEIVAGATHLFEEPGALECVAGLAGDWFSRHLSLSPVSSSRVPAVGSFAPPPLSERRRDV
ncbi:MAG TPA: dienelactone hydrolase family protein [Polyangiaceae bacterium]|nr:dienelactone hydrolase family protein [Polyangiaceae bacterium]